MGASKLATMTAFDIGCLSWMQTILQKYQPRASIVPAKLDFTDCPYAWPFCRQALYAGAMPLMFNATVLNGMGLTGDPVW